MSDWNSTRLTPDRLYLTGAIVVGASLPHWFELSAWIPALLLGCIGWRFAAARVRWPLPPRPLRLLLAFVLFSAVLLEYRTINGVTAGSALLIVMVALKFLESQTQRDQLVLMIIAYFLVFAGLLYQSSLLIGAYLIAFVLLTTVGLLQLGRGGALLPAASTVKLAGLLLLKAVPIMIVLFLLFPRMPGPLWAIPGSTSSGASGLDDTMSPGDITDLGLSDEIAFRVEFTGQPPAARDLYWRGPVLTEFNGRSWTRDRGMRRQVLETIEHVGRRSDYRVMLEPASSRWTFAIDMPARWDGGRRNIVMGSDYQLRIFMPDAPGMRVEYEVTSYSDYRALEQLSASDRTRLTALPAGFNPRTQALADEWRDAGLAPREIIERALNVFREDAFFYTLTPLPLGRHTADDFLFETREGFCEHYASAFTIMMRAAGIPARVVTGYQGGELNSLADYYIIRQSDAHAWTEVWLEGEGWVRTDPIAAVAPERIALGSGRSAMQRLGSEGAGLAGSPLLRNIALAWDAVNIQWNRWVVDYGPQLQRGLLERLGFERPRWRHLIAVLAAALVVVALAFSLHTQFTNRRRRKRDPAARSFERFAAKLRRAKVPPRAPHESPTAYAERAKRQLPGRAADIDAIVRAYLRSRYEPDPDRRRLEGLRSAVRRFRLA